MRELVSIRELDLQQRFTPTDLHGAVWLILFPDKGGAVAMIRKMAINTVLCVRISKEQL